MKQAKCEFWLPDKGTKQIVGTTRTLTLTLLVAEMHQNLVEVWVDLNPK